jgi:phosphopantothenoylcysteine decarboxylase/phosphopantothenate--cysteine ligase
MNSLQGRRIVLGVTGGVAAYKSAELVRLLKKAGAEIDVVLTAAAAHFVGAATFQALTGRRVWQALWDERMDNGMAHIDLSRGADALLVAPATADFIARLAQGRADDLLSTLCLARDCPLLVAPAMNRQMWEHAATRRNVAQIAADGARVLGPASGEQACGEIGEGRMLEAQELFDELVASFQPKVLAGAQVLLTAGPTFEPLDPVRGLTNSSSGKMGYALARACAEAGACVTLVSGPCAMTTPRGVRRIDVQSAREMHAAVMTELDAPNTQKSALAGSDAPNGVRRFFIGVAAVADYRPKQAAEHKLKKSGATLTLELEPNPDILADVSARADRPVCIGFAAESRDLATYAEGKRVAKRLDLVVGNLVQDGLGGERNAVTLFDGAGAHPLPEADKLTVARGIVAHLAQFMK